MSIDVVITTHLTRARAELALVETSISTELAKEIGSRSRRLLKFLHQERCVHKGIIGELEAVLAAARGGLGHDAP